jgi:hypothetical protein
MLVSLNLPRCSAMSAHFARLLCKATKGHKYVTDFLECRVPRRAWWSDKKIYGYACLAPMDGIIGPLFQNKVRHPAYNGAL